MAKPSELPRWADDGGDIVEPLEGKKDIGYEEGELPVHSEMNWLFNLIYLWAQYLDGLTGEALTWTAAHIFQKGITVTQSTTNTIGMTVTGNGTAAGGTFTGGSAGGANAWGLKGVGGGGNSEGLIGLGTGAGSGVKGTGGGADGTGVSGIGGGTNGNGVWGDGTGTGSGVKGVGSATAGSRGGYFLGGATSGTGVEGVGQGGNSAGVKGTGFGAAGGVEGVGGASDGTGVSGTGGGTNGVGMWGDGKGTGAGVKAVGDTGPAIECSTGNMKLTGAAPSRNAAGQANYVHKGLRVAASIQLELNGTSNPNILSGANIDTVTIVGNDVICAFPSGGGMATSAYQVAPGVSVAGPSLKRVAYVGALATGSFKLQLWVDGAVVDPAAGGQAGTILTALVVGLQ